MLERQHHDQNSFSALALALQRMLCYASVRQECFATMHIRNACIGALPSIVWTLLQSMNTARAQPANQQQLGAGTQVQQSLWAVQPTRRHRTPPSNNHTCLFYDGLPATI